MLDVTSHHSNIYSSLDDYFYTTVTYHNTSDVPKLTYFDRLPEVLIVQLKVYHSGSVARVKGTQGTSDSRPKITLEIVMIFDDHDVPCTLATLPLLCNVCRLYHTQHFTLTHPQHHTHHTQVPASINRHLREYQRDGVKFLYSLYAQDKGGILADGM